MTKVLDFYREILHGVLASTCYIVGLKKGAFSEIGKLADIATSNFIEFHNLALKVYTASKSYLIA